MRLIILQGQLQSKKGVISKDSGVVEYLQTIGVTLPEPEAIAEETKTEVVNNGN